MTVIIDYVVVVILCRVNILFSRKIYIVTHL